MGSYEATPAADGTSGSLTFGPIAATRALCPSPNLDERVARDLAFVRAYRVSEGQLYLSATTDASIFIWQSGSNSGKTP